MLTWNQRQVRKLSPLEIWLFILGRVLMAFAVGVLVATRFPGFASAALWPALVLGLVCFVIATRAMRRGDPQE